ncbi:EpsG family protein [Segatella copri]|uniref:EpsG family protein n=1 Tax=Segatella copri TaxID=165179 RepID=UPI003F972264
MELSSVDHILLYCTIILLAYIYDRQCRVIDNIHYSYNNDTSVVTLFLLGTIFVITEGLRYGRGGDQVGNYGPFYLHCLNAKAWGQQFETLFVWLNQAIYKIDPFRDALPYGIIFVVYALIFFICLYTYYKDKKKETKLFLVLAILATNYITEWTIRQGVSFSFILLGLHYLEQKRWKWMIGAMVIAFSIHHGNILAIVLPVVFYYFLNDKVIPWKITVPLFVVMEYTMQISVFQDFIHIISGYLNLSSSDVTLVGYMQDDALAREAEESKAWNRGIVTQLMTVFFYSSVLIVGAEACKVKNKVTYIYNAFVVGIMILEPFRLAGSITRMFLVLSCLWFIPVAYAIYNYKQINNNNKMVKWVFLLIICYLFSYYGRYVFLNAEANYIWNL